MLDKKQIKSEIEIIVGLIHPEINKERLSISMEQLLANYVIKRKLKHEYQNSFKMQIQTYLSALNVEGYKKSTLYNYRLLLNDFAEFVDMASEQVKADDIRAYLSSNDKLAITTIDRKLSQIRSFYTWLVKEEIVLKNPSLKIKSPKLPKTLDKFLTIEEMEMVRESCITLRERAIVEVFYSTACRLSELKVMKKSDINFSDRSILLFGKGDKERRSYLSPKAYYYFKKYLDSRKDDCEYLFVTERRPIRPMSSRTIQEIIEKVEKRSGLIGKVTPHRFRHTFATNAVNQGADLADVQHLLGHAQPSTTLRYARVSEERKKQAHRRFHVQ